MKASAILIELVALIEEMRDAQKAYFASRSPEALRTARRTETRVDTALAAIRAGTYQPRLEAAPTLDEGGTA